MIRKPCCSRFSLHKFVHLKFFWTQFNNVHLRGPCSLRPCISRPYCTNFNFLLKLVSFSSKQTLQSLVCKSELKSYDETTTSAQKTQIFQFSTIHQEQRWEFAFTVVDSLLQQWWINHMENSTAVQCTQLIQKYFRLIFGNYFYNVRSLLSVKLHLVLTLCDFWDLKNLRIFALSE